MAVDNKVTIDLQTLNALIPTVVLLHDSHDDRWATLTVRCLLLNHRVPISTL